MSHSPEVEFLRRVWDAIGDRKYVIRDMVGLSALDEFFEQNHSVFSRVCDGHFKLIARSEAYRTREPPGASYAGVYDAAFECGEEELGMVFKIVSYESYTFWYEGAEGESLHGEDPILEELDNIGKKVGELTVKGEMDVSLSKLIDVLESAFAQSSACKQCEIVDVSGDWDKLELVVYCGGSNYKMHYSMEATSEAVVIPLGVSYSDWDTLYPRDFA
jgi:hypothetical protein